MSEEMRTVVVRPGEPAVGVTIDGSLEGLQQFVGGLIEVSYPFDDHVGLVMNEEGKILGLPLNRGLRSEDGEIYDIIAGQFAVVGLTEDGFTSLTPEQEAHYLDMYRVPERFERRGNRYYAIPMESEMNREDFHNALAAKLTDAFSKDGLDVVVEPISVNKVQQSYDGLVVRPDGESVGVSLDTSRFWEQYKQSGDRELSFADAYSAAKQGLDNRPVISIDKIQDYDWIKDNLVAEVVGQERNKDFLDKVPHHSLEDLAVIYRIQFPDTGDMSASTVVTHDMLRSWGVSLEQLHRDALAASMQHYPAQFVPMQNIISSVTEREVDDTGIPLVVCNAQGRSSGGAGVIAYSGFAEKAAQIMGGDFYILPSSRHEVILMPDSGRENVSELEQMVKDINQSGVVKDEDILSDRIYHYDSHARKFGLATAHEACKAQQIPVAAAARKGR